MPEALLIALPYLVVLAPLTVAVLDGLRAAGPLTPEERARAETERMLREWLASWDRSKRPR